MVKPIPEGYHSITPYLIVDKGAEAIEFYKKAFGAIETVRMGMPGNKIAHAELKIGDSHIMLADEFPEMKAQAPKAYGGTPVSLHLYVENVDERVRIATEAGATIKNPLQNQFYGDRSATLIDPFGHIWTVSTHVEDVSPEETERRAKEMYAKG